MSATVFSRLLDEFRQGWLESPSTFAIDVRSPGHFHRGWEPSELDTVNYQTEQVIGSVSLPYTAGGDEPIDAVAVVAKGDDGTHSYLPSKQIIDKFERLCAEAGSALPLTIRSRLALTWETARDPASWWLSLLAYLLGFTVRDADGRYQEHQTITNPWQASIDAIEYLRLNTDSPGWPELPSGDDPPTFTPKELRTELGCSDKALNKYAKDAGVRTPSTRGRWYTTEDRRIIFNHLANGGTSDSTIAKKAKAGLAERKAESIPTSRK